MIKILLEYLVKFPFFCGFVIIHNYVTMILNNNFFGKLFNMCCGWIDVW